MKKIIVTILFISLLFVAVGCGKESSNDNSNSVSPQNTENEGTEGLDYYLLEDGTYAVSIGHAIFLKNITIPSMHNGKKVSTIIDTRYDRTNPNVESVLIPDSITCIGDYAFSKCVSLTSVTIPESVTSIGNSAFNSCKSLTSITIPNNVTTLGNNAFSGCVSLTSITIPNSLTSIGKLAFWQCEALTSIIIPNSVETIGEAAFSCCYSLTIYCEAETQPSGWYSSYESWNCSNRPVVWGYKG